MIATISFGTIAEMVFGAFVFGCFVGGFIGYCLK